jgi:hypothetical protein
MDWLILVKVPATVAAEFARGMLTIGFAFIVAFIVAVLLVCGLPGGVPKEKTHQDFVDNQLAATSTKQTDLERLGKNSIEAADLCDEIAGHYIDAEQFQEALPYAARAVAIYQKQPFRIGEVNSELADKLAKAQEKLRGAKENRIPWDPDRAKRRQKKTWSEWYWGTGN